MRGKRPGSDHDAGGEEESRQTQACKESRALASTLCLPQLPGPRSSARVRAVSSVQSPDSVTRPPLPQSRSKVSSGQFHPAFCLLPATPSPGLSLPKSKRLMRITRAVKMQIPGHCLELPTRDKGRGAQEASSGPGPREQGAEGVQRNLRRLREPEHREPEPYCFLLQTPPLEDLVPGPERATTTLLWD